MNNNKKIIKKAIDCIYFAREKLGVLQHHDAVTGTSKEKTNKDYENMAIIGVEKLKKYIYLLVNILGGSEKPYDISCGYEEELTLDSQIEVDNNFVIINPNLNGDHFFNYRLNIFKKDDKNSYEFKIKEGDHVLFGNNIAFNDVDIGLRYSSLQFNSSLEKNNLFSGLSITRTNKVIEKKYFSSLKEEKIIINNGELIFECETLKFIKDKNEFSLSHGYYTSYDGSNSKVRPEKSNPDGAYIFAPCENELQTYKSIDKNKSFYQQNINYTSIVLRYPNSYLIIIVQNSNLNIYTESIFDPIPRNTDTSYNYLLVLDSNIDNINEEYKQPQIFTDSEGINMMKRIKDTRPNYKYELTEKVSSNFYPITSVVSLYETNNKKNKVSIYSDRAQSAGFLDKGQIQLICQRFSIVDDWKGLGDGLYENSSMNRFFPVKHVISFHEKNYSGYFNKVPFILSVENTEKNKVNSNLDKIITLDDTIDVEFEAKKYGEIFIEVGNVYCDYYNEYGKENENIKFNYENGKIIEYNLNGVDEIKNIKNGEEISIKKQMFKSFLLQRNLSK
jgi:lysosomal alpha-mannosidase